MLFPPAALERAVTIREVVLRAMSGAISLDASRRVSCGAEYSEMFQQSVALVDKILKGAKPADLLPVEQPWLVINLKTAKALRLTTRPHCWRGRTASSSNGWWNSTPAADASAPRSPPCSCPSA
jgi:ABC-type uncharacterized transport system substrate-binding protein